LIVVIGANDKRQVTVAISSSTIGTPLPIQVIFTKKTNGSLPLANEKKLQCQSNSWQFAFTSN